MQSSLSRHCNCAALSKSNCHFTTCCDKTLFVKNLGRDRSINPPWYDGSSQLKLDHLMLLSGPNHSGSGTIFPRINFWIFIVCLDLLFLQDKALKSVWKVLVPEKSMRIIGTDLSRINSATFSALTVDDVYSFENEQTKVQQLKGKVAWEFVRAFKSEFVKGSVDFDCDLVSSFQGKRPPKKHQKNLSKIDPECTKIARFSAAAAAIFTAPRKIARLFEAPRCAISSAKRKSLANRDFLCDENG